MKLREQMPDLQTYTDILNASRVSRNDLIGERPTIIHFWSISCVDCKKRLPYLVALRDEFKGLLNVIAVHMPRSKEDMDLLTIKQAALKYNLTETILIDDDHTLTNQFKTRFVPAYYLFDKSGELRHYQSSGSIKMLKKRIVRLLEGR
ncbi:TlpA family protein disulfide reductase [Oceanobacillus bengalensis]|uniref:TlpA family protein disulfide reductase n=1 Tax=Oceanobacillus bengalensis TaxID=1435466 RepID=A0A494Z1K6_9BACI|nr:TlpA disulfide reductase family protein [Oceanobacillus bengalensis]RKQ16364.1 TlpA family protein disulfide reductase [Oceanobacillus bengalensis]